MLYIFEDYRTAKVQGLKFYWTLIKLGPLNTFLSCYIIATENVSRKSLEIQYAWPLKKGLVKNAFHRF